MFPHKILSATGGFLLLLLLLLPSPLLLAAQDNVWVGTASNDWSNPANWSLGRVPDAVLEDHALIDLTSPLATISGNVPSMLELKVGSNAPGQLNLVAGSATSLSTFVGVGSSGTFNLADPNGTGSAGTFTGLKTGTGSHDAGVSLHVGGLLGFPGGVGVLNLNTTGTLTVEHSHIGEVGMGTMNIDGGTLTNTAFMLVGEFGGVGSVNQSAGTVNVNNGWLAIGFQDNGGNPALDASKYRITGGELNVGLGLEVGSDRGGTLEVSGTASVNVANTGTVNVGLRPGGKGALNISGGSINMGDGAAFFVSREPGSTGIVTQTGGSIAWPAVSSGLFVLGDQFGSSGTYNLQGGSISSNGAAFLGGGGGVGTLNVSGGAATFQGIVVGLSGSGTVHQTGGSITSNAWFDIGAGPASPTADGRYIASGGTLTAQTIAVGMGYQGSMDVSGTAHVSSLAVFIQGGNGGAGMLTQSGGRISVSDTIFMGTNTDSRASLAHTGGTLETDALILGSGVATPHFATTGDLNVGVAVAELGEVNIRHFLEITGGTLDAGGDLVVREAGAISLAPDASVHVRHGTAPGTATAGNINIAGDVATIDGRIQRRSGIGTGRTQIGLGATLNGSGLIEGPLDILAGGTLAPGHSAGLLTSGDFSLLAGAHFSLEIGGLAVGTEHDALMVIGSVTLAGDLVGSARIGGYAGSPGDIIYVILNDGADPVLGNFFDGTLPILEGATVVIDGIPFAVRYAANADGGAVANDVALVRAVPEPGALLLLLAGLGFAFKRRR